jgi:hypothetical protein
VTNMCNTKALTTIPKCCIRCLVPSMLAGVKLAVASADRCTKHRTTTHGVHMCAVHLVQGADDLFKLGVVEVACSRMYFTAAQALEVRQGP